MNNNLLSEKIKNNIAQLTGFDASKITLLLSKHADDKSVDFDYHEFKYNNKKYIMCKDKIIK